MNISTSEIKKFLETENLEEKNLNLKALPQEEAGVFLSTLKQFDKFLINFDPSWLKINKNELQRWCLAYIYLHDLFHTEIFDTNINKLEIMTTAPIFNHVQEVTSQENYRKLVLAYFVLGLGSLKINPSLPHLISEKLILGEFVAVGGLENSLWGLRLKEALLSTVAKNIFEKTKKDREHLLIKKYKNFVFDFL